MNLTGQRSRFLLEVLLMSVSIILLVVEKNTYGYPDNLFLIGFGVFLLYVVGQFFLKLGLTLPFVFIVFWMILSIKDWNSQQALQSYNLGHYRVAIASVLNALIGVVVYFENKNRW